jgi:hypothetical protein
MVARVPFHLAHIEKEGQAPLPPRATIKALPTPHHPPSPLQMLMGVFLG